MHDVSAGGLFLCTDHWPAAGEAIRLTIPRNGNSLRVMGEVVRITPRGGGLCFMTG